jgi:succinylglutamate desuccinylase
MKGNLPQNVTKIIGQESGPSIAVFAGVHGDERAGIIAMERLSKKLEIQRGVVFLVLANPPAVNKKVRLVNKNINRCFLRSNNGATYEDNRARDLMRLLDECDSLLDLHAFSNREGAPFIICEENSFDVAQIFDVPIISSGWSSAEPGATDGYMFANGKVGICLECGPINQSEKYSELAEKSIFQFLKYYGLLESGVRLSVTSKKHIKAKYSCIRKSKNFVMDRRLTNFQKLKRNQLLAKDGSFEDRSRGREYIIFPQPDAEIGQEAYIIGEEAKM